MDIQKTDKWQNAMKKYSLWSLMFKYHTAKREYYEGTPKLTDREFDALETSIIAIHGNDVFDKYGCVGFEYNTYRAIQLIYESWCAIVKNYEDKSNKEACEHNSRMTLKPIIEIVKEIDIIKVFSTEKESSQLMMF